ncbi:MAG: rhomboid family intramembrane serine protease [Planctomycetota bacterium]|nr:rhomboid family intramembrane serine protease [Planctomycetota bacterium]
MFIPTRIEHSYERRPYATWALVAANVLVHVATQGLDEGALEPYILDTNDFAPQQLITSQFLHAGWLHLLFNMLYLFVYGRYVEDRLGTPRFLGLYFVCAVLGDAAFAAAGGGRAIGASGAVVGLTGFVLVAAPWVEVRIIFWFFVIVHPFKMAAFWLIGWWFLWELFYAGVMESTGVAHSAHFGGFAAGAAVAAVMRSKWAEGTDWWLEPGPYVTGVRSRYRRHAPRRGDTTPVAPGQAVVLHSLADAPSRVAVIKLLMRAASLEPDEASARLEAVAGGTPQRFAFDSRAEAERFRAQAKALGVDARMAGTRVITSRS